MAIFNKKALNSYDIVYWSVRIIFIVIMLFFIYFIARVYEKRALDTTVHEADIFMRYMMYNPNALSYVDNAGRAYPGVIFVDNLNPQRLDAAMSFGNLSGMIAANITLYNSSNEFVAGAYYNEQKYFTWLPLSNPKFKGAGTVYKANDTIFYVVYKTSQDSQYVPGFIKFEVLVPRT